MSQASAGAAEDKAHKAAPRPRSRPLSPHLQIWRWHVTMLGSILHRFTGLGLCAGAVVVTAWLAALAAGKETYALFMSCAGQPLALVVWVGLSFCAFYHLASGLRHLIWDTGLGLKPKSADALANLSVWFAVLATVAFWSWSFLTGRILP